MKGNKKLSFCSSFLVKKFFSQILDINVIENLDGFEWKGHGPLSLRINPINPQFGIAPLKVLQLKPSAPVTAVAMETAWGL